MYRFFLVLGPESSGTRIATKILINAGVFGDDDHDQRLDDFDYPVPEGDIVLRRSLPHRNHFPTLLDITTSFKEKGYETFLVFTDRKDEYMILSQLRVGHVKSREEAMKNIKRARKMRTKLLLHLNCPSTSLLYEDLVRDPHFTQINLFKDTKLPHNNITQIIDGNAKYRL